MKLSQNKRIEKRLMERGEIGRNECIRNFITRLSARINDLEKIGWQFQTIEKDNDYIYKAIKSPYANL